MHPLVILYESQNQFTFLEGPTANSTTVVSAEPLLVYRRSGQSELSRLLKKIHRYLTTRLIIFFHVVNDSR